MTRAPPIFIGCANFFRLIWSFFKRCLCVLGLSASETDPIQSLNRYCEMPPRHYRLRGRSIDAEIGNARVLFPCEDFMLLRKRQFPHQDRSIRATAFSQPIVPDKNSGL
ncbi:hypothetical protein BJF95_06510 [Rhizobium oryziradicis]|uniref:Uncharacterized protein n=1 Tax=Rhizobium oryziradicis TaxID=1867956 RepID=A0A1Q8ZQ68_9HYPH|nr:hypothetical protein BJF95_06510 [Rhizobium oryziradicis]